MLLINVPDGRAQAGASSKGRGTDVSAGQGGHLGVHNTIGDLLRHPAFTGFAHLILPWDERAFRGRPGAPFAVIAPGGGFSYVAAVHEGFPHAAAISSRGYHAFVLKYRAGFGGRVATQDLAAAVSFILGNAEKLGVATMGYSLWGSSAGARMAAAIGSHGAAKFGGRDVPKPSAVVMAYTAHSDYAPPEPPTFVVVGEQDGIAPPAIMERRVDALRKSSTEVEYRVYKGLGHMLVGADATLSHDGGPVRCGQKLHGSVPE